MKPDTLIDKRPLMRRFFYCEAAGIIFPFLMLLRVVAE
jgi:hypothetical protein